MNTLIGATLFIIIFEAATIDFANSLGGDYDDGIGYWP